jgi:hypothetical protein
MAIYTAILDNGLSFNVKAQTINQASEKVQCFLLDYPALNTSGFTEIHTEISKRFDRTRPFITMTKSLYQWRYKTNPNSNKKTIALLLALV